MAKKEKKVNKITPKGLQRLKLGGGENADAYDKAAYSNYDNYHEDLDGYDNRSSRAAADNLKGTGINPPSPQDIKNALREKVEEEEFDRESTRNPITYMTPGAESGGFSMKIGSKENFSDSNFSSKDQSTMASAPAIMKDNWGGESIELKDQGQTSDGSPLAYKGVSVFKQAAPSKAAWITKMNDKKLEQNTRNLQNGLAVVAGVTDIAGAAVKASDRRLKNDIKLIGLSSNGLKIYNFKYKDEKFGKGTFQGVMSDEIPQDAVIKHKDGFDRVDYSLLDVEFKSV